MKGRNDAVYELQRVRALLTRYRAEGDDDHPACNMLYGAQQALLWAIGTGLAPSKLEEIIQSVAEDMDREQQDRADV